jgi:hypothetical protein
VESFRNQLLASAALADDQHGTVKPCRPRRAFDAIKESGGLANELDVLLHSYLLAVIAILWQHEYVLQPPFILQKARKSAKIKIGTVYA